MKPASTKERLQTFEGQSIGKKYKEMLKWPYKSPSADTMASLGFFFTPTKSKTDQVSCVGCSLKQAGWSSVKDVVDAHLEVSPNCAYSLLFKAQQQRDFWTESTVIRDSSMSKKSNKSNSKILSNFDWSTHKLFKNPKSSKVTKVRNTINKYWQHPDPSKKAITDAGLYNMPLHEGHDVCICLYCKISLEDWVPKDNPLEEHKKMSPNCYFFTYSSNMSSTTSEISASQSTNSEISRKRSSESTGALISTGDTQPVKRSKRLVNTTAKASPKKQLLDDCSDDSLHFLKKFELNKENRLSEDFDSLTFDKSIKKFKSLQKYNTSISSISKEKDHKPAKHTKKSKKKALVFDDDDDNDDEKAQIKSEVLPKKRTNSKSKQNKQEIPVDRSSKEESTKKAMEEAKMANDSVRADSFVDIDICTDTSEKEQLPENIEPERRVIEMNDDMAFQDTVVFHGQTQPNIEIEYNEDYDDSIAEASEIMSPEKKDPSLYSNSNVQENMTIPKLKSALKKAPVEKLSNSNRLQTDKKIPDSLPVLEQPSVEEKKTGFTKIDPRHSYSLNPIDLDDSDYDASISVYEKVANDLTRISTPAKNILLPLDQGTEDVNANIHESTPITPSIDEIPMVVEQQESINAVQENKTGWTTKDAHEFSSKYDDLKKANEFLKDISCLDYQLSEDIDGVLSTFVGQIPEKELNMSIKDWIQFQTRQCKKLLNLKCEEMVKEFEKEGERAIEFLISKS